MNYATHTYIDIVNTDEYCIASIFNMTRGLAIPLGFARNSKFWCARCSHRLQADSILGLAASAGGVSQMTLGQKWTARNSPNRGCFEPYLWV